jgi:hypothetical protein
MPSAAVDRAGDLAVGYSKSNSTTNPQIKYAGRLAGDPVNTLGQGEQTLIDGTGAQSGSCGGTCTRWGDYSGMALDPNGCEFWMTNEYYITTGLNHQTRIGSFHFPGCPTVGNGTLSGTVTDGTNPLAGVTVALGNRTTTTNGSGNYSFIVPAGTYASLTASKPGFDGASTSTIAVPDGGTATRNFTLTASAQSGCFTDNTQSTFQRGVPANCDLTKSPGDVVLASPDNTDSKASTSTGSGFFFSSTSWAGQTFTPTVTGQLKRVDIELFCVSCSAPGPNVTLSIRNTSGTVPTGGDLGTATLAGFNDGGAGGPKTFTFSSPITLTAGTRYAFVFRASSTFTSYAYTCSCSPNSNPYANGQFVTSSNSGSSWTTDNTAGGRDLNFVTYINPGFASNGTYVSSLKDANPAAGGNPTWTTLSFTATQPAGTSVKFQIAASNNSAGPFNFVGPDGTAGTFFTSSGASLSQFNGLRYLRYKAFLSTSNGAVTPSLSSVTVCFVDTANSTVTALAVAPATGTFGGTTNLSATLTLGGNGVSSATVGFTLNGNSVGSATTNATGVATLNAVSLAGINAGSYPTGVGASFAGDGTHDPSTGSGSLTVAMANQAISVTTHAPASGVFNTSFGVAATGGGSGNPVTFSSAGACSNTGSTFTMTSGTGTCSVRYDQAGNSNYNPAPQVTESVTAQKAGQTINVTTHAPASAVFNTSFGVAATGGGSGNPVTFSSSGSCSNTGATFTMTSGTGTCAVRYDQAGNSNYNAAPQVVESVNAQKADQTITVTQHAPSTAVFNTSFGVAGNAPGGVVTFTSGGACSNNGSTFTMTSGTGTCTVNFVQGGNANYNAAPTVTESTTAQKADQTITVTQHAPASAGLNSQFTVAATAPGGAVSFSSSGACTNGGATFTMTSGSGTCSVKYDQAGNANFNAAPQVTELVNAQKQSQTITVTQHAPASAVFNMSFSVAATGGGSGNLVTFSSVGACSNIGATFTMTSGTGTCSVRYDQAGDANFEPATQVVESVTAVKASQSITVAQHAPASAVFNTSFSVAATGGASGNAVTFSSSGSCSNTGATFTMTSGTGACSVQYDQAGNSNYNPAPQVTETVNAQKANQTITVSIHAPANAAYNTSFGVQANAPGGVVSFSSSGACSNSGNTFTMTSGTGTCTVEYDQAGNSNYNPAPQVTETVNAQKANQTINVTNHAPASASFNQQFTVAATGGGSGNPVTFSSSGVCSNTGDTFTVTSGSGTCTVQYDQGGNSNYNPAPQVTETLNAQKANQTINVTTHAPASASFNQQFTVAATGGGSGNTVTFSSGGACTNSGATFTITSGTGTCSVRYDQAGDANYDAAPQVTETVSIGTIDQAINVTIHAPANAVYNTQFTVAATGGGSGNPVTFSSTGTCTNNGATFTVTSGTGTCSVSYDQAGNGNYNPAPQITESVNAQRAGQTITFGVLAAKTFGDADFAISASASSGLAVSFAASGNCTISGATMHITGAGSCTVTASQAGNANVNAATEVAQSFSIGKAAQTITFAALPNKTFGAPDFTVHATASSGLAVFFAASGSCSVNGTVVHLKSAGTCTLTASQSGNADYNAANSVVRTFKVLRSPCSVPSVVGKKLAAAKTSITKKHCRIGNVGYAYSTKVAKGHVVSQSRRAGQVLVPDAKINIVVSRGRRL